MKVPFSQLNAQMRFFQAQSLIGFVHFMLPLDQRYDKLRSELFDVSMKIISLSGLLDEIEGEKTSQEKGGEL